MYEQEFPCITSVANIVVLNRVVRNVTHLVEAHCKVTLARPKQEEVGGHLHHAKLPGVFLRPRDKVQHWHKQIKHLCARKAGVR